MAGAYGVVVESTQRDRHRVPAPAGDPADGLVAKVVEGRSALEAYQRGVPTLGAGGRRGLGRARPLGRRARPRYRSRTETWRRVLAADPRTRRRTPPSVGSSWTARGWARRTRTELAATCSFEGRWVTPAEHEALRARAHGRGSSRRLEAREAGLRVREAEARAQEAEARAREAQPGAAVDGGIPYGGKLGRYGYGQGHVDPGAESAPALRSPHSARRLRIRPPMRQSEVRPTPPPMGRPLRSRAATPPPDEGRTAGVQPPPRTAPSGVDFRLIFAYLLPIRVVRQDPRLRRRSCT